MRLDFAKGHDHTNVHARYPQELQCGVRARDSEGAGASIGCDIAVFYCESRATGAKRFRMFYQTSYHGTGGGTHQRGAIFLAGIRRGM